MIERRNWRRASIRDSR